MKKIMMMICLCIVGITLVGCGSKVKQKQTKQYDSLINRVYKDVNASLKRTGYEQIDKKKSNIVIYNYKDEGKYLVKITYVQKDAKKNYGRQVDYYGYDKETKEFGFINGNISSEKIKEGTKVFEENHLK